MSRDWQQELASLRITPYYQRMSTENEILAEVEALKVKFSDTKALYREVCALLFFRYGITPTTNKLYQYVRKGTMGTPAEALAKFWDELRGKARIEIDHPDLPQDIKTVAAEAIAAIWQQATAAARSELAVIRDDLQAATATAKHREAEAQAAAERAAAETGRVNALLLQCQRDLEAERLATAGIQSRLAQQEQQLEEQRSLNKQLQERFSNELEKARTAVEAAHDRAAAAEKRALLEVEHERQARIKADRTTETLRGQLAQAEARERDSALRHTEAYTRLQANLSAAEAARESALAEGRALTQRLAELEQRLEAANQDSMRHRTEASMAKELIARMAPPEQKSSPKATRKRVAK